MAYNSHIATYNPKCRIWGRGMWGKAAIGTQSTSMVFYLGINATSRVKMNLHYQIVARYTLAEPTVEDVYSYATDRFMRLKCMDGPVFPFFSTTRGGNE